MDGGSDGTEKVRECTALRRPVVLRTCQDVLFACLGLFGRGLRFLISASSCNC
jgi:hypothetical protein